MADQITKSVRRIVKGMKDDPLGLGEAEDYKGIGTSRGEAYINARGDVTGSGSDGSGEDKDEQPPSSTPDTGTPDDNDTGGGGGTNNGSSPEGALDGDVDAVVPVIETDTQVGTVTGTDPVTGDPVSLSVSPVEDIEYNPPPNWDDPDEGPLPEGWTLGTSWFTGGDAATRASYPAASADLELAIRQVPPNTQGWYSWDTLTKISDTQYTVQFHRTNPPGDPGPDQVLRFNCTNESYCATDPDADREQEWPTDGNCEIVWDYSENGYKGNVKDPDCSAAQKTASDSIIIRSVDDSNKYYKFTRLNDGRTKISEVDSGGVIITDSVIKVVGENGRYDNLYPADLDGSIN